MYDVNNYNLWLVLYLIRCADLYVSFGSSVLAAKASVSYNNNMKLKYIFYVCDLKEQITIAR